MIISFDQLVAVLLFLLGIVAGIVALLEPLSGIVLAIIKYLKKLFARPQ